MGWSVVGGAGGRDDRLKKMGREKEREKESGSERGRVKERERQRESKRGINRV